MSKQSPKGRRSKARKRQRDNSALVSLLLDMVWEVGDVGEIDAAPLGARLASLGSRYGDTGRLLVHCFLVERALEFHQLTKNPLYLWEVYQHYRQRGSAPLPEEVTEYFDRVAAALLKGRGAVHKDASVFIAKALEMRHMGRGTVFDTTKDERDEQIASDMLGRTMNRRGSNMSTS
jgi:hypothetical protein